MTLFLVAALFTPPVVALPPPLRALPKLSVTIDGVDRTLGMAVQDNDGIHVPMQTAIKAVTNNKAEVSLEKGNDLNVAWSSNKAVLAQFDSIKNPDRTSSVLLTDPVTSSVRRTEPVFDLPYILKEADSKTYIDVDVLSSMFGVSYFARGARIEFVTPTEWAKRIGVDPAIADGNPWQPPIYVPDFGVSPPGKVVFLWFQPQKDCYVQIYRLSEGPPEPVLAVNPLTGEERPSFGDLFPHRWHVARNQPVRVETEALDDLVGDAFEYVAVMSDRDPGETDMVEAINSGLIKKGEWSSYGLRQQATPERVVFSYVNSGNSVQTLVEFSEAHNQVPDIVEDLNGPFPNNRIPKNTNLIVLDRVRPSQEATDYVVGESDYQVQLGQTFEEIAKKWGVTLDDLLEANDLPPGSEAIAGELLTAIKPRPRPAKDELAKHRLIGTGFILAKAPLYSKPGDEKALIDSLTATPEDSPINVYEGDSDYFFVVVEGQMGYVEQSHVSLRKGTSPNSRPADMSEAERIRSEAQRYLGLPYVWGGNSLKTGVDCSHYVNLVFKRLGYKNVPSAPVFNQENYGDYVYWKKGNARAGGVTIYFPSEGKLENLRVGDRFITQRKNRGDAVGSRHTGIYYGPAVVKGSKVSRAVIHAGGGSRGGRVKINAITWDRDLDYFVRSDKVFQKRQPYKLPAVRPGGG